MARNTHNKLGYITYVKRLSEKGGRRRVAEEESNQGHSAYQPGGYLNTVMPDQRERGEMLTPSTSDLKAIGVPALQPLTGINVMSTALQHIFRFHQGNS